MATTFCATLTRDFFISLAPITLKTSEYIRLGRVTKGSIYKEEIGQLVVPLRKGIDPAEQLVTMLGELIPRG